MKPSDFNKVVKKLKREFDLIEDSTDHVSYEVWKCGKMVTMIKRSHAPKGSQLLLVAKNLHLSKPELIEYKNCKFSNEDFIKRMKEKRLWIDNK